MYLDVAIAALTQRIRADKAEAAIARAIPLCELGERYEQGLTDQDVSFGEVLEVLRALDGE